MGFLTPDPIKRPHYCERPRGAYPEGTRWQCDECKTIYRIEQVMDRNIVQLEWVKKELTVRDLLDS